MCKRQILQIWYQHKAYTLLSTTKITKSHLGITFGQSYALYQSLSAGHKCVFRKQRVNDYASKLILCLFSLTIIKNVFACFQCIVHCMQKFTCGLVPDRKNELMSTSIHFGVSSGWIVVWNAIHVAECDGEFWIKT